MRTYRPESLLLIAAARHVLDVASSDYLKQAANDALAGGIYSPALTEVAMVPAPIMSEIGPQFRQALQELGLPIPDREAALWHIAAYHAQRIADGEVSPRVGMRAIRDEVEYPGRLYERSREFFGDSHDLHVLYGMYYGYDDLAERPDEVSFEGKYGSEAIAALDAAVVAEAKAWLLRHSDITL
ncbi:MAG: hypothetical protein ABFD92_14570 [Planctomycetaceae bacterium]|nr:hypothetical protein [Planctomycetaceae bacterium]